MTCESIYEWKFIPILGLNYESVYNPPNLEQECSKIMVLDLATWKVANENLNRDYKISPFATKGQKKRQIPTHLLLDL
jgi:hypothetical protein